MFDARGVAIRLRAHETKVLVRTRDWRTGGGLVNSFFFILQQQALPQPDKMTLLPS
jgi:hypothetical protein